ncbi:MAG: BON domain-containing protein [Pigmentiphaga sp.]
MRHDRSSRGRGPQSGYGHYDSPGNDYENGPLEAPSRQEPRYAWPYRKRPTEWERAPDNEYEQGYPRRDAEYGERPRQAGARGLHDDEWLYSRSADPGQSSYGGFRDEDPSYQRQDLGRSPEARGHHGGDWRRDANAGYGSSGTAGQRYWRERYATAHGSAQGVFGSGYAGDGHPETRGQRIDPKGYTRSDERVREIVCEHLSHSGWDVSDVAVNVAEARVTLEGTVPDRRTKHAVEDCVDQCAGVKDVENRVKVTGR